MTQAHGDFMAHLDTVEGKKMLDILRGGPLADVMKLIDEMPLVLQNLKNRKVKSQTIVQQ